RSGPRRSTPRSLPRTGPRRIRRQRRSPREITRRMPRRGVKGSARKSPARKKRRRPGSAVDVSEAQRRRQFFAAPFGRFVRHIGNACPSLAYSQFAPVGTRLRKAAATEDGGEVRLEGSVQERCNRPAVRREQGALPLPWGRRLGEGASDVRETVTPHPARVVRPSLPMGEAKSDAGPSWTSPDPAAK